MSPAVASDAAVWRAVAGDALASSPIVKAVTLSKNPLAYWRLDDSPGNGPELITVNPSFETGNTTGWSGAVSSVASDFASAGIYSAKFTGAIGYMHLAQIPTLPVGRYKFTAKIKTSAFTSTAGAGLVIEFSPNATALGFQESGFLAVPAGTADWTLFTTIFRVTQAGTVNLLFTNSYGGTSTGTMWVDDLHCAQTFAKDSSGFGADATLQGVVTPNVKQFLPGDPASDAMTFDGTSGWGVTSKSLSGLTAASFAAWCAMPNAGNNNSEMISDTTNLNFTFRIRGLSKVLELALGGYTDGQNSIRNAPLGFDPATDHGLHFVGVSWSAANGFVAVVDGVVVDTRATNIASIVAVDHVSIANCPQQSNPALFFGGTLKELIVYGSQLSTSDWRDIYLAGKTALGAIATAKDVLL